MNGFKRVACAAGVLALTMPGVAFAHPGHGSGHPFVDGLLHPFTGADHLLAMVLVGLWSGFAFRGRPWVPPVAFLCAMVAGYGAGMRGLVLPGSEYVILASLVVFGALTLAARHLPPVLAVVVVAFFAFAHGLAHGTELGMGSAAWRAGLGMVTATAALLFGGLFLARQQARWTVRATGAAGALCGAAMFALAN